MNATATRTLVSTAFSVAVLTVCAWLQIPFAVPFTLQTFGIFVVLLLFGWKQGLSAVFVYLLLGAFGLPVFSNFSGGIGHLLGPTGGFLLGFLPTVICFGGLQPLLSKFKTACKSLLCFLCLLPCYTMGMLWYIFAAGGKIGTTILFCIAPFLLPDFAKIVLAVWVCGRVKPFLDKWEGK